MALQAKSLSFPSSNPLFSTITTLYTLILIYFPTTIFHIILFFPVFLSTSLLLLCLLRLSATQKNCISTHISPSQIPRNSIHDVGPNTEQHKELDPNPNPDPFYVESFIEWNVGTPLEVIHEEYEDEEEIRVIEKYGSLSLCYPDIDMNMGTDSSSGGDSPVIGKWDSPENWCFEWEEEDGEGLIEIELEGKRNNSDAEEENLIEIDLTPANFPAR